MYICFLQNKTLDRWTRVWMYESLKSNKHLVCVYNQLMCEKLHNWWNEKEKWTTINCYNSDCQTNMNWRLLIGIYAFFKPSGRWFILGNVVKCYDLNVCWKEFFSKILNILNQPYPWLPVCCLINVSRIDWLCLKRIPSKLQTRVEQLSRRNKNVLDCKNSAHRRPWRTFHMKFYTTILCRGSRKGHQRDAIMQGCSKRVNKEGELFCCIFLQHRHLWLSFSIRKNLRLNW